MEEIGPTIGQAVEGLTRPSQMHLVPQWVEQFFPREHDALTKGIVVADVGCGCGNCLVSLSKKYPQSEFHGIEPDSFSVQIARKNNSGYDKVEIIQGTSSVMKDETYDLIMTWDVVHDLSDPENFLKDIYRALKPGGVYLMNEVPAEDQIGDNMKPERTFIYSISTMYCLTLSMADGGPGYGACMGEAIPSELCAKIGFSSFIRSDAPS